MKLQLIEPGNVHYNEIKEFDQSNTYKQNEIEKYHSSWIFNAEDYELLMKHIHEKPKYYLGYRTSGNHDTPEYIIEYGEVTIAGVVFKIAEQITYNDVGMRTHSRSKYISEGSKFLFENKLLDGHYFVIGGNVHYALMHLSKPRREENDRFMKSITHYTNIDPHPHRSDDSYNVPKQIIHTLEEWSTKQWYENYYEVKAHELWLKIYHPFLSQRYGFVYPAGSFNRSIDFSIPKAMFDENIINFAWWMPPLTKEAFHNDKIPNPILMVDTKYGNFRYDIYISLTKEFIEEAGDPLYGLTVEQEPPLQCEIRFALKAPDWFVRMARKYKLNIHF